MSEEDLALDTYAFGIQQRLDAEMDGPEGYAELSKSLSTYKLKVRAEGREPFSHYLENRAQQEERVRNLFADPDVSALTSDYDGPNAREYKQRVASIAYLSQVSGHSTEDATTLFPVLRNAWAKVYLGKDEVSESELFQRIAENIQLDKSADETAKRSAFLGSHPGQAFAQWMADHAASRPMGAQRVEELRQRFMARSMGINQHLRPHRLKVEQIINDAQILMGASNGESPGANWESIAGRLLEVPKADRPFVLQAIMTNGAGDQNAKGVAQKLGENVGRGGVALLEGLIGGLAEEEALSYAKKRLERDDVGVPANWREEDVVRNLMNMQDSGVILQPQQYQLRFAGEGGPTDDEILSRGQYPMDRRRLSAEEKARLGAQMERRFELMEMVQTVRDIADKKIDPAGSDNVVMAGLYGFARSAPQFAAAFHPIGWVGINGQFARDNYYTIRAEQPEMSRDMALSISRWTAPVQSLVEVVSDRFLLGRLPNVLSFLKTPAATWATQAKRLPWLIPKGLSEYGEEKAQHFAPYFTQHLVAALSKDVKEAPWEMAFQKWEDNHAVLISTVVWMTVVGHGAGNVMEVGQTRYQAQNPMLLEAAGFSPGSAVAISKAAQAEDWKGVEGLMQAEVKAGRVETDGGKLVVQRDRAAEVVQKWTTAQQNAEATLERLGALPTMGRDQKDGSWYVKDKSGEALSFTSHEEANAYRWSAIEERSLGMHAAVREALEADERKLRPGEESLQRFSFREVTVGQQQAEVPGDAKTLERRKEQAEVLDDGFEREAYLAAQAVNDATARDATSREVVQLVVGRSYTEFAQGIRRRVLEFNQHATPLTVVEESVEDDARRLLSGGQRDWLISNLRELEKKTGERLFVAAEDASLKESDIIEAYSHVAVSYFAGKSRKGEGRFKNNKGWLDAYRGELRTMGIQRLLDATATKLYAMFRRSAKLMRLSQKGQMNEAFERQLTLSLGLEQVDEAGKIADSAAIDFGAASFSLESKVVGDWVNRQQPIKAPQVKLPHGGEVAVLRFAREQYDRLPEKVTAFDGKEVILKHNAQGTEDVLLKHLTTSHDEQKAWVDRGRVAAISRIPFTIANAHPRFIAKNGNRIYIQRYDDGKNHYVIVDPQGRLINQAEGDVNLLITQWVRRAEGDTFLKVNRIEFGGKGSPSSARSEQGGATGTSSTSPSQSGEAPGMPGQAGPIRDNATQSGVSQVQASEPSADSPSASLDADPQARENRNGATHHDDDASDSSQRLLSQGSPADSNSAKSSRSWSRGRLRLPQHVGKHYVTDIPSLLNALGISDLNSHVFTQAEVSRMLALLVKSNPVDVSTLVTKEVYGNGAFSRDQLLDIAQGFVSMLPASVTGHLKAHPFSMRYDRGLPEGEFGAYMRKTRTVLLHPGLTTVSRLQPAMYHELMHWVYEHGPQSYRDAIKKLMRSRTGGFQDPIQRLRMSHEMYHPEATVGMPDDLAGPDGDEYAGRIYPKQEDPKDPNGLEIPTIYLETLALHPSTLVRYLNYRSAKSDSYAWREVFFECLTILF